LSHIYALSLWRAEKKQKTENRKKQTVKHIRIRAPSEKIHLISIGHNICVELLETLSVLTVSLNTNQPVGNLLHIHQPSRCLRSASQNLLFIPFCTTNFSKCSFSYSTATIWNELPATIRQSNTLDMFKRRLKNHLTSLTTRNV